MDRTCGRCLVCMHIMTFVHQGDVCNVCLFSTQPFVRKFLKLRCLSRKLAQVFSTVCLRFARTLCVNPCCVSARLESPLDFPVNARDGEKTQDFVAPGAG